MSKITVKKLYEDNKNQWELEILAGSNGMERYIQVVEVNRPGLALAGYFGYFAYERVQVLGKTEITYLNKLSSKKVYSIFNKVFNYDIPCCIITRRLTPPPQLIEIANKTKKALLRTNLKTTSFISKLSTYLEDNLAPSVIIHGTLVDVFGIGILILGKSGIGKSECSLSLIKRGHRLVADDVIHIRRSSENTLIGRKDENLGYKMEIRGVGIIDVKELFGISSVRDDKQVELVAVMEEWKKGKEYERLGIDEKKYTILDVDIPKIVIPVRPGRDIALILELAAVNLRAKKMGISIAKSFEEEILNRLRKL
jgi:HPr kinase/phosphorylase